MATPQMERTVPDVVEEALIKVDAVFLRTYGSRIAQWPRTAKGEYLEALSTARRKPSPRQPEFLPAHPRRSSAASRRHHQKYLAWRLRQIVPGAATVLVIPMWEDLEAADEPMPQTFLALVRDAAGRRLKPPEGATPQIVRLLQTAFVADWSVAQTWRAVDGSLTARRPRVPEHMQRRWI